MEYETCLQRPRGPCVVWYVYAAWVCFHPVSLSWPATSLFLFWEDGSYYTILTGLVLTCCFCRHVLGVLAQRLCKALSHLSVEWSIISVLIIIAPVALVSYHAPAARPIIGILRQ